MGEPRPPEFYVVEEPMVLVPARVCAVLERHAGLDVFRRASRGVDGETDRVLVAMHLAALGWRSQMRTKPANDREPEAISSWVTAQEAADRLRCTTRAVQKALAAGRLRGELVGGRWLIDREDFEHYRAGRSGHGGTR